ncbi:21721_t:CDS:2, partial [Gigaspora rosea]
MLEAGTSELNPTSSHLKNSFRFQKDISLFSVLTSGDVYPDTIDQTSILETGVSGMGTHWTCSTPRLRESEQFSNLVPEEEMDELYKEAENYLNISKDPYNITILQTSSKSTVHYDEDIPQTLPLAVCFEKGDKPDALSFNFWNGSYDIIRKENFKIKNFTLICLPTTTLQPIIKNSNWDIEIPALGKNLCKQIVAYCQ